MNQEQRQAYEWAKNQDYQSVDARYAKILAGLVDEIATQNEPLSCGLVDRHGVPLRAGDTVEQDFRAFAKQWWEEDSGFPCRWCKFERQGGCEWKAIHPGEICAGRAFEWRGKKED